MEDYGCKGQGIVVQQSSGSREKTNVVSRGDSKLESDWFLQGGSLDKQSSRDGFGITRHGSHK